MSNRKGSEKSTWEGFIKSLSFDKPKPIKKQVVKNE